MTYEQLRKRTLNLDLHQLSTCGQIVWSRLAALAAESAHNKFKLYVGRSALTETMQAVLDDYRFRRVFSQLHLVDECPTIPDAETSFAYLTGSAVFSPKLIERFHRIHVEPSAMPYLVESRLYWKWIARPDITAELDAMFEVLADTEARREHEEFKRQIRPADRLVTLLTSVFNGDCYLEDFLDNMAGLVDYKSCEHFLIRPGSTGREHQRLIRHVRRWPGTVYINLASDPGLYEVWNLGTRLATGQYLSNANLDDRRAPDHLALLIRELDTDPDIAAASTALRISITPNLKWEESASCAVWFGELGDLTFKGDGLIIETKSGLASRNLLHCMPVWRRQLHAVNGWFNEKAYGPAADWEFWLRLGLKGMKFRRLARPLGLYLENARSYGHQSKKLAIFVRKILAQYGYLCQQEPQPSQLKPRSFGLDLAILQELAAHGAWLEMIGWWLSCSQQLQKSSSLETGSESVPEADKISIVAAEMDTASSAKEVYSLLKQYGLVYFGATSLPDQEFLAWINSDTSTGDIQGVLQFIIDLMHQTHWPGSELATHIIQGALVDGYVCSGDQRWLVALAFSYRRLKDKAGENSLLQAIQQKDSNTFFKTLPDVYRSTVALTDIVQ